MIITACLKIFLAKTKHEQKLAKGISQAGLGISLKKIRDAFDSPEEINNNVSTAPSKRIAKLYPAYEKPLYGSLAAIEIGLDVIRKECHLFDAWLKRLEALQPIEEEI